MNTLDISKNINLITLYAEDNKITNIDTSNNLELGVLGITNNQVSSLDVTNNPKLSAIYADNNKLTSLDISSNTNLYQLFVRGNALTALDVSNHNILEYIYFDNTNLISLNLFDKSYQLMGGLLLENRKLNTITLTNGSTSFDLKALDSKIDNSFITNVEGATLEGTILTGLQAGVDVTYQYRCNNTTNMQVSFKVTSTDTASRVAINETNFPDANFRKFVYDNYSDDGVFLNENASTDVKEINVNSKSIVSLKGIEYFTSLETLKCSYNKIEELNIGNNINLKVLECYVNNLTNLNLDHNTNLETLGCNYNQLTTLDLSNNINIENVFCNNNKIQSVNFGTQSSLKTLEINNNELTTIDVSVLASLVSLNCSYNKLETLDLSNNYNLETINCLINEIEILTLGNLSNVKKLNCSSNKLSSLDVSQLVSLENLHCYLNELTIIDISNNTELQYLDIGFNPLYTLDGTNNPKLERIYYRYSYLISLKLLDKQYGINMGAAVPYDREIYTINLDENETSFDLKNLDPNINPDAITIVKGATLEGTILKGLQPGVDVIYNYSYNSTEAMDVRIFVKNSNDPKEVNYFTHDLHLNIWIEGETPYPPSAATKYGEVQYTYSNAIDGIYTSTVPTTAGTWYIKASVEESDTYTGIEQVLEFVIEKGNVPEKLQNVWSSGLTITGWVEGEYNELINAPKATAKYGTVVYTYSNTINGVYTSLMPTTSGTYYVKASVIETETYTGLEQIVEFVIEPKVVVEKQQNEWLEELTIQGWTEGQYNTLVNAPKATAKYGTVVYTYSKEINGMYSLAVPQEAGTYYVKAAVYETDSYTSIEAKVKFIINPQSIETNIKINSDYSLNEDNALKKAILNKGYILQDGDPETIDIVNAGGMKQAFQEHIL
ncbi:MAG: hypothetical protein ACK5LC_14490 [Coprobacillaceae bacterium]